MTALPRSGPGVDKDNKAAITSVRTWLHEQDKYLFTRQYVATPKGALARIRTIEDAEAQQAWDHFQKYRSKWQTGTSMTYQKREWYERSNFYALATAALAREKFVLTGVAQGYDFKTSERASWGVLDNYIDRLNNGGESLPPRVLLGRVAVADVVEGYRGRGTYGKIEPTFTALAGCAMTALAEQAGYSKGKLVLPDAAMIGQLH